MSGLILYEYITANPASFFSDSHSSKINVSVACHISTLQVWQRRATRVLRRKDMTIETKKRRGMTININKVATRVSCVCNALAENSGDTKHK